METLIVTACAHGSSENAVASLCDSVNRQMGEVRPIFIAVFASTQQPLTEVMPLLSEAFADATVVGASTAGEFIETGDAKGSVSLFALAGDFKIEAGLGRGLKNDPDAAVGHATSELSAEMEGFAHRAAILLLDPMAGNGEAATLLTAAALGEGVRLAGGAAGDDLNMKEGFVGLGKTAVADALVVVNIFSKKPLSVGVQHGHRAMSKALTVTKSEGSRVYEIDHRSPWDVWVEHTRENASRHGIDPTRLPEDDVGGYLLRYEAGIAAGDAFKVRAPLAKNNDGSISFASGVPEGTQIQITESDPERQIESAKQAAIKAMEQGGGQPVAGALVFDCICRNLILGYSFARAVRSISQSLGDVPIAGFETYGEIAMDAGDMSGFHNTTTVVLAFPK